MGTSLEETVLPTDSPYTLERGFPAPGTAEVAYDAADLSWAIEAYKFFYPTVSTEAVMLAVRAKVNNVGIVMATSPRQQFGGAKADMPYVGADGGRARSTPGRSERWTSVTPRPFCSRRISPTRFANRPRKHATPLRNGSRHMSVASSCLHPRRLSR